MGAALTSICKRGEDDHSSDSIRGLNKSIKTRMLRYSSDHRRTMSSKTRMDRYPSYIAPLRREVHAPCRPLKKQSGSNVTFSHCYHCVPTQVFRPLRNFKKKKGKDVTTVDPLEDVRIDDSGVEEIASVSSDQRYVDEHVDGNDLEESDEKALLSEQRSIDDCVVDIDLDPRLSVSSQIDVEGLDSGTSYPMYFENIENRMVSLSLTHKDGSDADIEHQKSIDDYEDVIDLEELDEKARVDPGLSVSSQIDVEGLDSGTSYPMYIENIENWMDSLSLTHKDGADIEHQKSMRHAKRVDSDLNSLKSSSDLDEIRLPDPKNKPEKDKPQEAFVPLTAKEKTEISSALSRANRRVLATHRKSNIEITGEILQCLKPGGWLNDEIINVYMELLKEREMRDPEKFLHCHFFNTFFYKKLISGAAGYDFKSVRRWTTQKKLGYSLVDCDKIFIPVHKEMHWCLAVINKKDEKFQYLDSLRGTDSEVFGNLVRYFVDEVKDKSKKDIDVSSWEQEFVADLPVQHNGWDCGMFMIKYVDFYSRGWGLNFNQGNMEYFRMRTVKEICELKVD